MKERDSYIDILKGVGIVLVVFVHTYKGSLSGHIQFFKILTVTLWGTDLYTPIHYSGNLQILMV